MYPPTGSEQINKNQNTVPTNQQHHQLADLATMAGALRANYHRILGRVEHALPAKLRPLYNHPAGPKTVFFWAPMFKWGLVMAGLADMSRPAEKLSLSQSGVLTATAVPDLEVSDRVSAAKYKQEQKAIAAAEPAPAEAPAAAES
ncbi:hypothetical protein CRUP_011375 [Coryphaenoides rupestris]|nr:hypothetical protein CRUP_011375 [Coryphaenoides rupestris]